MGVFRPRFMVIVRFTWGYISIETCFETCFLIGDGLLLGLHYNYVHKTKTYKITLR